jgi:hypothetical protein
MTSLVFLLLAGDVVELAGELSAFGWRSSLQLADVTAAWSAGTTA